MKIKSTLSIVLVLAFAAVISVPGVYATSPGAFTINPTSGAAGTTINVSGTVCDKTAIPNIFIFFDNSFTTESAAVTSAPTTSCPNGGAFNVNAAPGPSSTTTVNVSSAADSLIPIAQGQVFTVNSNSIPDFPFSYSLVIMFVAVSAVYLVIRQRMATPFKI
jgi:hypothetical protein